MYKSVIKMQLLLISLVPAIFCMVDQNAKSDDEDDNFKEIPKLYNDCKDYSNERFLVSIRKWNAVEESFMHICSGSFISRMWILTAGHCVERVYVTIFAVPGYRIDGFFYRGASASRIVKTIIHPKFNNVTYANDIAMLRIRLYVEPHDRRQIDIPLRRFRTNFKKLSEIQSNGTNRYFSVSDSLCVYCENQLLRDLWTNDSGGPILCNGVQVGIATWGTDQNSSWPCIATRVDRYLHDFIFPMMRSGTTSMMKSLTSNMEVLYLLLLIVVFFF